MRNRRIVSWVLLGFVLALADAQPPAQVGKVVVRPVALDGRTPAGDGMAVLAPPEVAPETDTPQRLVQRVSLADGAATFHEVPYGPYRVHLYFRELGGQPFKPTRPPALTQDFEVTMKEVVVTVPVTGLPLLVGRLTEADGKTPVVAKVLALDTVRPNPKEGWGGGAEHRWGKTNLEGRFCFVQPPAEPCTLTVTLFEAQRMDEGVHGSWEHELTQTTPKAEGVTELELSLPRFSSVAGRIFDLDGKPLANAEVGLAYQFNWGRRTLTHVVDVTTGRDGSYRVASAPPSARGTYAWVKGKGHAFTGPLRSRGGETMQGVDYRLRPFATVNVTLRDWTGKPVAGQWVSPNRQGAWEGPDIFLSFPSKTTDPNGQCTFPNVAAGTYSLPIPMNTGRPTPSKFSVRPGQKLDLTVTFGAPESLHGVKVTGRVTDARGRPVAGAQVHLNVTLKDQGWYQRPLGPVTSGDGGAFTFEGVPPGQHVVFVTRSQEPAGFMAGLPAHPPPPLALAWQYLNVEPGKDQTTHVACPDPSGHVVGRATDRTTRAPLAGVNVMAVPPVLQRDLNPAEAAATGDQVLKWFDDPFPHTTTGADGSYSLGPLPPGEYTVIAASTGFPVALRRVVVPATANGQVRADFARLPETAQNLRLRLLTEDGKPLTGTPVKVMAPFSFGQEVTTDAGGRLQTKLGPPGRSNVILWPDGFRPIHVSAVGTGSGVATEELEFRAKPQPYAKLPVRVLWGDTGRPAAEAVVHVGSARPELWSVRPPLAPVATDADGKAMLDNVPCGWQIVSVAPPGPGPDGRTYAVTKSDELEVRPGAAAAELAIRLQLAGSVSGIVSGPDGQPLQGVSLAANPEDDVYGFRESVESTTGADGSFRLDALSPGQWTLYGSVGHGTYGAFRRAVVVEAGKETADVRLRCLPEGATPVTVSGRVLGPDGRTPAAGTVVRSRELAPPLAAFYGSFPAQTMTDADGRFQLQAVAKGPFTVEAWVPGVGVATSEQLTAQKEQVNVDLTIAQGATLTGRVLARDGKPVPNAEVLLQRPARDLPGPELLPTLKPREELSTFTDDEGRFHLEGVPPSDWLIYVATDNLRRSRVLPLTLKAGQAVTDLTLHVEPFIPEVTGRVLGPDGKTPVAEARLELAEQNSAPESLTAYTDDAGAFRLRYLPPGDYSATITPEDRKLAIVHCPGLKLEAAASTEFRVPRAGAISGRVVGARGQPGPGWSIRTYVSSRAAADSKLTLANVNLRPDGTYRLERLASGEYTIFYFTDPEDNMPAASVTVALNEGEEAKAPEILVER